MEISMLVEFRILQKINGKYIPISNKEAKAVSIGGFGFEINGAEIPFDWDAFTGTECNKVFQFQTGKGSCLMIMKSQIAMMKNLKK